MNQLFKFVADSGRWGITSEVAALAAFLVAFSEHIRDKPLPAGIFVSLSVLLIWYGAYEAWTKKLRELEKSQQHIVELERRLTDVPRPPK